MKKLEFNKDFIKYSEVEKKDYLKQLIKNYKLDKVIIELINNNKDVIQNFKLLNDLSKTKIYKEKNKLSSIELNSLIINKYLLLNKTKEINKYIKSLDDNKIKKIIQYEVNNKTEFSKIKFCKELENKFLDNKKDKKVLKIDIDEQKRNKASKRFLRLLLFLAISYMFVGYCYSSIIYYNSHVYPNVFIDDMLIENMDYNALKSFLKEKEDKLLEIITLKNDNDTYTYTYEDLGFSVNTKEIETNILNITNNLNGYQKLYKILTRKQYKFNLNYEIDDNKYNNFIEDLRNKVNVSKTKESFRIVNGKISYTKGISGFTLEETNLKQEIINSLKNNEREITLKGNVDSVSNSLGSINKRVSTFTTYYNESQGRAKNIRNAVSKLNGTIVYPGNIFSFYRVAGPYNGSRGYIFYAKDVGSGVCQVSTTVYNNALRLNLPIVSRENHGDMVYYVDYGLDATVYGSSVDMKFKNNSSYPIYIEASAYGGTLTVNFWSNENIIPNGYSYVPRVERVSSLGFKTYLDTYKNGERIESKYLNSSYYLKGK